MYMYMYMYMYVYIYMHGRLRFYVVMGKNGAEMQCYKLEDGVLDKVQATR